MERKKTYLDIARLANVSKSAVSKALNGASDVSEDTRKAIFEAAQKLGYNKNSAAKFKRIGFLVQNTDFQSENDFGLSLLNSFRRTAFINNYEVILLNFDADKNTKERYSDIIEKHKLLGAFFIGLDLEHVYATQLKTTQCKTVVFDNLIINENVSCVGTNSIEGIITAVDYLFSLGHKKIGFMNGTKVSYVSNERLKGYIVGLEKNGIHYDADLVSYLEYDFKCNKEDAKFFVDRKVSAIICACDKLAIGLMAALRGLGLKVPGDISVVGFDNINFCEYVTPSLTTVSQDRAALGEWGFYCLKDIIEGRKGISVVLPSKLIVRDSTKRIDG